MSKQPTFKKLILDDLKSQGLYDIVTKITSIRYRSFAGGDSVDVAAVDLGKSQREKLESILREYQAGSFDGMQDLYTYDRNSTKVRQAKYVHLRHKFSKDIKAKLEARILDQFDINPNDDMDCYKKTGQWKDQFLWRKMCEFESKDLNLEGK